MELIRELTKKIAVIVKEIKWKTNLAMLSRNEQVVPNSLSPLLSKYREKDFLIVAPHADDELIGCHHFISNHKGVKIFYCSMTGSKNDITNKNKREEEFKRYCELTGAEYYVVNEDVSDELSKYLKLHRPKIIILTSCVDWHKEHREVNYILYRVIGDQAYTPDLVGWYSVTCPIPINFINYQTPVSKGDFQEKKQSFLKVYESQNNLPINRFMLREKWYSNYFSGYASEPIFLMSISAWREALSRVSVERMINLKSEINNLHKIYKLTKLEYEKLFLKT